ncbi:MAG: ABC transporter ATP-binding protein [Clostridiales bacterium]|nr:ABC transporter ATP-binding protein [Clostridiales bacterium]
MPEIILENVTKRFGKFVAVDNLNLNIESNSFITLLGPSGCGKTTTLRMIAGLETPTEGRISIDGKVVFDADKGINLPPNKRDVGFLFQNYALWPHMTVYQNIAFGLQNLKWSKDRIRDRVRELLKMLRIEQFEKRYPSELSGGQQQRVAIARTLAPGPKVLFMDEPLSNLDAKLRMEMRTELKRLHRDTDSTFVYVTHDQLEAMTLSTRVCIMDTGVLQQYAPPLEMYNNPANLFVADFMGNPTMNFIDGTASAGQNGSLDVNIGGKIRGTMKCADLDPEFAGGDVTVGIRPEYVKICDDGVCSATVYSTLPSGMETTVKLDADGMNLTAVVFGDVDYPVDSTVRFNIVKEAILFDKSTGRNVLRGLIENQAAL